MRAFLTERGLWSEEKEAEVSEAAAEEVREAIQKADDTPKQKVSEFLRSMYETPTAELEEQIAEYEEKENA